MTIIDACHEVASDLIDPGESPTMRHRLLPLLIAGALVALAVPVSADEGSTSTTGGDRTSPGEASPTLEAAIQSAKLTASDPVRFDTFGLAVAVSGDTAVVGTYNSSLNENEVGSAYVFVRSGAGWTEQARLTAPGGGAVRDYFGVSVAVSGDTAVIGQYASNGVDAGSAYVFVRSGTVWTQQAKLTASDAAAGDAFGNSVALSGSTAVVGAHFDDTAAGNNRGSAYVFVRSGTVWTQQAKLSPADAATAGSSFGASVAVSGSTAVVSAQSANAPGVANAGAAYVFARSGTVWAQQAKLAAADAAAGDLFGTSVAVSGSIAVVGAYFGDAPGVANAGAAYVFARSGTAWTQQAKLNSADEAADDHFGISVAVSGGVIVVGARGDDNARGVDAGSAYVFLRSGVSWPQRAKLTAPDGATIDGFGAAVAVDRTTALVGAPDDNINGIFVGSAYAFQP